MVLFTHNVKKMKDAAHKNGDVDGTRKRPLILLRYHTQPLVAMVDYIVVAVTALKPRLRFCCRSEWIP